MMDRQICDCDDFASVYKRNSSNYVHYNTCVSQLLKGEERGEFPNGLPRNPDGSLRSQNAHLKKLNGDFLYHLSLGTQTDDLKQLFGDVKFICMGGTAHRMKQLARRAADELGCKFPSGYDLIDMTEKSHRYSLYKVGPVISINHGIGMSTLSVVLQEVIKLLQYSGAKDPIIFRVGTSGGIGIDPGTVVISKKGYNGSLKDTYDIPVLTKMRCLPAILDQRLAEELKSMSSSDDDFETVIGNTMCADDFYNGQGRTDGPFCDYSEEDKMNYLRKLNEMEIKNIEMEVTGFAALTHKAGIKAADVCVTLVNRLQGDQVLTPKETLLDWQERPMTIVLRYMKKYLENIERFQCGNI